jgi:hypothetical protein
VYVVDQIAFKDVLALVLELNEDGSFLTYVAVCIGYIIGASISEELVASFCMVV